MDPAAMTPSDRLEARQTAQEGRTRVLSPFGVAQYLEALQAAHKGRTTTFYVGPLHIDQHGRVTPRNARQCLVVRPAPDESVTDHDAEPRVT